MLDLKIDRLQLEINNAAGHEHRIVARPTDLDLKRTSDEHAARTVADTWPDAPALRLTWHR